MKQTSHKEKFRTYEEVLLEDLKNPEMAAAYLNVALMDKDPRMFLLAIRDICKAQEKEMSILAQQTQLNRENFYRSLSKKGNPKLTSIISVLNAVGFSLAVRQLSFKR